MVILSEVEKMALRHSLNLVYLFGSKAQNIDTEMSDTDIAILLDENKKKNLKDLILDLVFEFSQVYKTDKIDLLILNNASLSIQFKVITKGKLLYQKNSKIRTDYEEHVIKLYLDFKKYEEEYYKAMHDQILEE